MLARDGREDGVCNNTEVRKQLSELYFPLCDRGVSHGVSPPDSGQAEEAEEAVYVSLHLPQLLPLNQLYLWKNLLEHYKPLSLLTVN